MNYDLPPGAGGAGGNGRAGWATQREATDRAQAERSRRREVDFTSAVIESLPGIFYVLDGEGRFVRWNKAGEILTGLSPDELLHRDALDVIHEEDREAVAGTLRRALAEGFGQIEARVTHRDGGSRHLLLTGQRTEIDGVVFLVGTGMDITARKRVEEQFLMLAVAVEQVADDIVIMDAGGRIRYVNAAFERTTGYTREEARGRSPRFLDSGQHTPEFYAEIDRAVAEGRTWKGRFSNRTKDGRFILQDASIAPIRDTDGRVVGQVSARRDVTRDVEMEERALQAYRLQAMGTLAGGIAHDFNNILSAIIGYTQMAQMKSPPDSKIRHDLDAILQGSRRAAELVKQILAFSRQGEQEARPVQVGLIVKEATKFLRASIPSTIDIRTRCQSEAVVLADPAEIHRVVVNLCTNSALAMKDGGGVLEVALDEVDLDELFVADHPEVLPGRYVRLRVADTGCGMSREVMSRVFEPFFTTRPKGEGTGMGLAVVHGVVKGCRGLITVESKPAEGSTFQVYLPAVTRDAPVSASPSEELPRGAGRVLVVDDEPLVANAMAAMLQSLGYSVRTRTNGFEALAAVEADPGAVDLVVTDLTMPGMTGDLLTRRLKALRPSLPVVLCTGFSDRVTPEAAQALGIDEFVMKPILMGDLARMVSKVLART